MKSEEIAVQEALSNYKDFRNQGLSTSEAAECSRVMTIKSLNKRIDFIDNVELTITNKYIRKKYKLAIRILQGLPLDVIAGVSKFDYNKHMPKEEAA